MRLELILEMAAEAFPERTAISLGGWNLSYSELLDLSVSASGLVRRAQAGSLAYVGDNHLAFPVGVFAASIAGVPFVPLNYRLPGETITKLLSRLEKPLVISYDPASRREGFDREEFLKLATASPEASQATEATTDASSQARRGPDEPAVTLFTSGTTKEPKAAILRHRHLMSYLISTVEFASADPEEAALVSVPPYHVAGLANLLSNLYACRRIVYMPSFDAAAWIDTVESERITQAMVVPTMLARIIEELEARSNDARDTRALGSLRTLAYGGSKVPRPVIERAISLLDHVGFVNAYGLTETSSTICVLGPEEHRAALESKDPSVHERLFSVGRPVEGIEVRIIGDHGKPLAPGKSGRIAVRGEQVSGEYATTGQVEATTTTTTTAPTAPTAATATTAEDETARTLAEQGWFLTGDLGHLDEEGYLFIEGRSDDTIIRGGENIAPAEIEDVLTSHPLVAQAAAFGVPDEHWGQRIVAVVVAKDSIAPETSDRHYKVGDPSDLRAELMELCRQKLRSSRMPERIELVQSLPMTDTGKVIRRILPAMLESSKDAGESRRR